jgi:4-amino-4-deoxy-L-arabinose transferase-like glycosyltransferase
LLALAALPLYFLYIYDLTGNPPGFYIDEAFASFNAYQIAHTGRGEFGQAWPLYFPVMQVPGSPNFYGYLEPIQVYALAALFSVFAPSILLPRLLSATAMFLASLLLGLLVKRISGRLDVGVITAVTALLTPWLFEVSRLAFSASLYPLAVVLFLLFLHIAHKKDRWPWWNCALIAVGLALCTYTYSIGRLLGPLLAFGLIVFATDRDRFKDVLKTWAAYVVTLIPMLVFHLSHPNALTGRFDKEVGIFARSNYSGIASTFLSNFAENINPLRLLLIGDTNLRHHIGSTGPILAASFILALAGIVIVIARFRNDPWWRYMLFGLVASIVPASLTKDQFHMLRLDAFPVFLLIFMVPALIWFLDVQKSEADLKTAPRKSFVVMLRRYALPILLLLTVAQAAYFQFVFRKDARTRDTMYDVGYRPVFNAAIAQPKRPIYLVDGYWGQAYIHSYWYATIDGIDLSNFVHAGKNQTPPVDAIVITADDKCDSCEPLFQDGQFVLYRQIAPSQNTTAMPPPLK